MAGEVLCPVERIEREAQRLHDAVQRVLARPVAAPLVVGDADGRDLGRLRELRAAHPTGDPQNGERLAERDRAVAAAVRSHRPPLLSRWTGSLAAALRLWRSRRAASPRWSEAGSRS